MASPDVPDPLAPNSYAPAAVITRAGATLARMSSSPVTFAFPDGQVVHLDPRRARRVADRLRELSARPGAVVCATIITEALRQTVARTVEMGAREADALATVLAEV
jgi:hypothetical protein